MKTLQVQNVLIEVSEGRALFGILLNETFKIRTQLQNEYEQKYSECGNLDNLIKAYWDIVNEVHEKMEDSVYDLVEKYTGQEWDRKATVDFDDLCDKLFTPFWNRIIKTQSDLDKKKAVLEEYRRQRRKNRPKYSNDVRDTWAAQTVRNAFGNAGTSMEINAQKTQMFKEGKEETAELVANLFDEYCFSLFDYLEKSPCVEFEKIKEADRKWSIRKLKEAENPETEESKRLEDLKVAIERLPVNLDAYKCLIKYYGDKDNQIEKFANECGVFSLSSWKKEVIEKCFEGKKAKEFTSEQELLTALDDARKTYEFYGVSGDNFKYVTDIKTKWESFDRKRRTVEGVEYSTREESEQVRSDLKYLQNYSIENNLMGSDIDLEAIAEHLKEELRTDGVKKGLVRRLEQLAKRQDAKNIQETTLSIISSSPIYNEIKGTFIFGDTLTKGKNFVRLGEQFSEHEQSIFAYDPAFIGKGKQGLLFTNKALYYYNNKVVEYISLSDLKEIVDDNGTVSIHKNNGDNIATPLKVKIKQIDDYLFSDIFADIITAYLSIKNAEEITRNTVLKQVSGSEDVSTENPILEGNSEQLVQLANGSDKREVHKLWIPICAVVAILIIIGVIVLGRTGNETETEMEIPVDSVEDAATVGEIEQSAEEDFIEQTDEITEPDDTVNTIVETDTTTDTEIVSGESEEDLVANDSVEWDGLYQRSRGPAAIVSFWENEYNEVVFSASIGYSGSWAYVDIRDFVTERISDTQVVYQEENYEITFTYEEDGTIRLDENIESPYGVNLAGTYVPEEIAEYPSCEFVFPQSDVYKLSESDYEGLTIEECRIAVNEIYARHGRLFNDPMLQNYFDACSWYSGSIEPDDFTEDMLNDIEIANLAILSNYQAYLEGY